MKSKKILLLFLINYFKSHLGHIGIILIFILTILFTFYLYGIPMEPFFDAFLFSGFILLIYLVYRILKSYKKHIQLNDFQKNVDFSKDYLHSLSMADGIIEADYIQLLSSAIEQKEVQQEEYQLLNQQLLDYYGLWIHQIKVPISALDLLIQTSSEDSSQMRGEIFKINEYLNMMLQFLRQNLVNDDLVIESVELSALIKKTVKKYSFFFIHKDLSIQISPFTKTIYSDPKWLAFILEQILFNAIKYTKRGGIKVYLENDALVIEDSGIGILEEDLPRIFEKGYTGYNGRKYEKATGLGLYMCRTIADKLAYDITIQSEVNKGTKVIINFLQKEYQVE